jgi:hypothetical protein
MRCEGSSSSPFHISFVCQHHATFVTSSAWDQTCGPSEAAGMKQPGAHCASCICCCLVLASGCHLYWRHRQLLLHTPPFTSHLWPNWMLSGCLPALVFGCHSLDATRCSRATWAQLNSELE